MDVLGEVDTITREQIEEQRKVEQESRLVPKGSFEGVLVSWNKVEEEEKGENNQYKQIPQYNVGIKFFDCPESGKSKVQFFNMITHKLLGPGGQPKKAYTTCVQLVGSLGMESQPMPDVFEQAKVTRLKYRVDQFVTPDGNTVNYLQNVSKA